MLLGALVVCWILIANPKPRLLIKDCDLIALARFLIRTRGRDTVRVTKV